MHGTAGDSTAAQELLVRESLAPEQLPLYRILNHTPSMGPAAAHVLAQQYGNLGNLMASEFLNPSKCASWCQWDRSAEWPHSHLLLTLAAAGSRPLLQHEVLLMCCWWMLPCRGAGAVLRDIADLQKPSENRRRIGPAAAQKLFRVLTASDPELPVDERHEQVPV